MADVVPVFLRTLLAREQEKTIRKHDMPKGEGLIGLVERDREAAWMCSAGRELGVQVDTIALAISIFDRVVSIRKVAIKYANCVATASLHIARKLFEDGDVDADSFLRDLSISYSKNELLRMEMTVLEILDWDALLPSCDRFVSAQMDILGCSWAIAHTRLLLESSLTRGSICRSFRPSVLALSVVSLVLQLLSPTTWLSQTTLLCGLCRISMSEVSLCREAISRVSHPRASYNSFMALSSLEASSIPSSPSQPLDRPQYPQSTPSLTSPQPLQLALC